MRLSSAWLGSLIGHAILFFLLALITVSWTPPRPRMLTLQAAGEEEALLESPVLEAPAPESADTVSQPMVAEPSTPPADSLTPNPPQLAHDDSGVALASAPSALQSLRDLHSAAGEGLLTELDSRRSDQRRVAFFGVGSQGNSVCFVVDSSRSMRGGRFDLARAEVMRAVAQLKPTQRFFVMLFDQNVERMQLSEGQPAQRPVRATSDNVQRLAGWLAAASLESGGDAEKAMHLAIRLNTDIVFLLTDGELPESLLTQLRRENRLAGEAGQTPQPRASIHTVGLHSRRGQRLLMQIARENGGQYRFVGKPTREAAR